MNPRMSINTRNKAAIEDAESQRRFAWKPTPEAFEAFKVRDMELAIGNVRVLKDAMWDSDPDGTLHNLITFGRAKKAVDSAK